MGPGSARRLLWAAALGLVLFGLATRASGLVVTGAALAALVLRGYWDSRARLARLQGRRELYPSAFEGDRVAVTLVLENQGHAEAQLVELTDSFGPGLSDRQVVLDPGPLAGRRRRRLAYRGFCTKTYGVYGVGPLVLSVADPLGLFTRRRALPEIEPFAVFPRVYPVAGLARLGARTSLAPQELSSARTGASAVYLGVRDYQPGDELRRVHWPATARRGSLLVKEFETDLAPYFTLFLDLDAANRAGTGVKSTHEYVVRTAASLLWSAVHRGDTVQVLGEGRAPLFVPPGAGELHLHHALYELIRLRLDGARPLLDLVEEQAALLLPGSVAALLLGSIRVDEVRLQAALTALEARRVRPLVVLVNSESFLPVDRAPLPPAEASARAEGLLQLLHGHGAAAAVLGAGDDLEQSLARADLFEAAA